MPTHPITGARYPTTGASPNGPQQIQDAVSDLSTQSVPQYATSSARDSAFAAWTAAGNAMRAGMVCFTQSDGRFWRWSVSETAWVYAGGKPPPITALTVATGWGAGTNFAPGCYKDANGFVYVVGGVTNNVTYSPAGGAPITLPTGYRPTRDIAVPIWVPAGAGLVLGGVYAATGNVQFNYNNGASIPAGTLHTLNFSFHPTFAGGALA